MRLRDQFERAFVINLARRKDRWEQFVSSLPSTWPFEFPERFSALDGHAISSPASWNSGGGAWGCYRSHLAILEKCLSEKIGSVLILEDDAICGEGFADQAEQFISHLPEDWNFIYFGGQHIRTGHGIPHRVNDFVFRPFNVNRCHAYALKGTPQIRKIYYRLLNYETWRSMHHIDHQLGELHSEMVPGLYVPHRWLIHQREGQSDISGSYNQIRDFPNAEVFEQQKLVLSMVAVLALRSNATETLIAMLRQLGVSMGDLMDLVGTPLESEEAELRAICNDALQEPLFIRVENTRTCVRKLKRWAQTRCYASRKHASHVGGYHPALSLLGRELETAWSNPKLIVIDHVDNAELNQDESQVYPNQHLIAGREAFLSSRQGSYLRVDSKKIETYPEAVFIELADYLGTGSTLL